MWGRFDGVLTKISGETQAETETARRAASPPTAAIGVVYSLFGHLL